MRRIGKQIPRVLALVLLMVDNAHANNGPGPGLAFGPFLLIFLLILLSTAGGAYPILAHLDPNRNRWWRHAVRWAGAIGIILSAFVLPGAVDDVLALIGILGGLAAISLIIALVTSGTTWVMGADRAQAMAALDGAAPRSLGTLSQRFGTPINVNLMSGIVATIVAVTALTITDGDAAKYFVAALGLAISTTTISYLAIFPALWKLRRSHPHVPRPYKVPGGMAGVIFISVLTFGWALFATLGLLFPGIGTADPDGSLPEGFTRIEYELTQFIPLVLFILLGLFFYWRGKAVRDDMVAIPFADEARHDLSHVVEAPPED